MSGLCGLKRREGPGRLRQDWNGCVDRGLGLTPGLGGRRGVVVGFWITGLLILRMTRIQSRGRRPTVLASGMLLADAWRAAAGKGKQVQRPGVAKDRLNEWVVRAQAEGRARTAAAGLKWARGQGLGVKRNVWWDAWRAEAGKEKRVRRPGVDKKRVYEWVLRAQQEGGAKTAEGSAAGDVAASGQQGADAGTAKRVQRPAIDKARLNEWVVRAQEEGGARTAEAGLKWLHGQGLGVDTRSWGEAWRAAAGTEKRVWRSGLDKARLYEWVVRAQEEGGARTAKAGLEWVRGQGFGVDTGAWGRAPPTRGRLRVVWPTLGSRMLMRGRRSGYGGLR